MGSEMCIRDSSNTVSLGQALNLVNGPTIADAIADPENAITALVAAEDDPAAIVDELYLSFLCRHATEEELEALTVTLDPADVANAAALAPGDAAELARRQAEWEASQLPVASWSPLTAGDSSRSAGGATLERLPDGAIRVTGTDPERDDLSIVLTTDLPLVTGLRLEVLPHPDLPASGPGRAKNGNFVLNELTVTAVPLLRPDEARPVVFSRATASFSQDSWDVAGAIDGKPGTGWAVSPRFGEAHVAVFETAEDLAAEGGLLLVARLQQSYGSRHTLGHFRLSATGSARPVRHLVLPGDVLAALTTPPEERTPEQAAALHAHYVPTQPDLVEKIRLGATQDLAWALANNPAFLFNR